MFKPIFFTYGNYVVDKKNKSVNSSDGYTVCLKCIGPYALLFV